MTVKEVLEASKLFTSTSDMIRALKNKAIKINGLAIEDLNEEITTGDFLNFVWLQGAMELVKEQGLVFLAVSRGKDAMSKAIVKKEEDRFVCLQ